MPRTTPAASPLRVAAEIVAASVLLGALMGVLWWKLAPEVTVEIRADGAALYLEQSRKLFDREAVFAMLGAGAAVVPTITFALRHRRRPVTVLVALVAGGIVGSLVAVGVGRMLGPESIDPYTSGPVGSFVPMPLELDAWGVLLVWPLVAAALVAVLALVRDDRSAWGRGRDDVGSSDEQKLNPIGR